MHGTHQVAQKFNHIGGVVLLLKQRLKLVKTKAFNLLCIDVCCGYQNHKGDYPLSHIAFLGLMFDIGGDPEHCSLNNAKNKWFKTQREANFGLPFVLVATLLFLFGFDLG
jgi:hypothetical protein